MKVQPFSKNAIHARQNILSANQLRNHYTTNSIKEASDIFVKNTNLSFGKRNDDNRSLSDGLAAVGMVGAPLLLGITAGILLSDDNVASEHLFDNAELNVDNAERSVTFGALEADADDGIFRVKGTGIDINPTRFDYSDPENGIYMNFDGSADIDLQNGKYIDRINGIFVDEEKGLSAIVDSAGNARHIVLPTFCGSSMSGTRINAGADVINDTPDLEHEGSFFADLGHTIKHSPLFEKLFGATQTSQAQDMFGRNIVGAIGDNGKRYVSTASTRDKESIEKTTERLTENLNDKKLRDFMQEHYQEGSSMQLIDLDGDGKPDGIDLDGDGKIDIRFMDTTQDGRFDSVDIDGDGIADGKLIDMDGDGTPDGIDIDGDGKIDIFF